MNPSKATVFRLQRNHKDVTTDKYADNLTSYLDTARSCKNITMTALNNILFGIASYVAPLDFSIGRSEEETNFVVTLLFFLLTGISVALRNYRF